MVIRETHISTKYKLLSGTQLFSKYIVQFNMIYESDTGVHSALSAMPLSPHKYLYVRLSGCIGVWDRCFVDISCTCISGIGCRCISGIGVKVVSVV